MRPWARCCSFSFSFCEPLSTFRCCWCGLCPPAVIGRLLLYALPATVPFALPLGVLVGILVGLSRMSADNEIVAMRAAGVSSATIIRPVLAVFVSGVCDDGDGVTLAHALMPSP